MRHLLAAITLMLVSPALLSATTFAQLALGGGYEAVLIITNKTAFQWSGTIWVSRGYNQLWEGRWAINGQDFTGKSGATLTLVPHGSMKLRFTGDGTTRSGYLEIDSDVSYSDLDIAYSYFYEFRSGGRLQDTIGSPESAWDKKFVMAVEKSPVVDTGLAWCQSNRFTSSQFPINLTLYDEAGNIFRQRSVTFTGHQAQFVTQIFTDLPAAFVGHLKIESQDYMYLTVLRMEQTSGGFQLTSTPPDDYVP